MPLRIRDPKATKRGCVYKEAETEDERTSTRSRCDSSFVDIDTSAAAARTTCFFPPCSISDGHSLDTALRYVSSFTVVGDVTFTTTQKPRSSITNNKQREIPFSASVVQPLDLSQSSHFEENEAVVANCSALDGEVFSLGKDEEDLFSSGSEISSCCCAEGGKCNRNSFLASTTSDRTDKTSTEILQFTMLSSRRHRSDETFADRERFSASNGKSTYPNSADAWVDSRGSPEDENVNGCFPTKENFDLSSELSYKSEQNDERETITEIDDRSVGEADDSGEQETAFNYSTRNRAAESTINSSERRKNQNVMKAKRARVENIVTSIKDKPNKSINNDQSNGITSENLPSYDKQSSRKRKLDEKIKALQRELATLTNECESDDVDAMYEANDVNTDEMETLEDWGPQSKRAKPNNNLRSPRFSRNFENRNGLYRGSVNFAFPQNGCHAALPGHVTPAMAYEVLVESLKKELTIALEKVAEKSAKRVLEELRASTAEQVSTNQPQSPNRYSNHVQGKDQPASRSDDARFRNDLNDHVDSDKRNSSPVLDKHDKTERLQTSSQSHMNFGAVRDRKTKPFDVRSNKPSPICLEAGGNALAEKDWESKSPSSDVRTPNESPKALSENIREEYKVQTQALSLVKKKLPSSSSPLSINSSPPARDERPFVIRSNIDRYSSSPPTLLQDKNPYLIKNIPASRAKPSEESLFTARRTPPGFSPSNKLLNPLFGVSGLYPPASSAFRLPFRHDGVSSSPFRRDPFASTNMLKPPFFEPSIYPTSAHGQSSFPFTSGQIPFPLLQSLQQQRTIANAIADYGRFKEGFEPGNLRALSTRTSTRESSRSSGLPRTHAGPKADGIEYRRTTSEVSPYSTASIQEGLTPQHLKKAKLMFFYTRYPSANTLKTFFADVKFSRATTSQLIKWFSNFREFYYIQMEKFARQALSEGFTETSQVEVTRDSELFRVLNLHYNKSNDFRVPNEFLNVTVKSLQEFFQAIKRGKDQDPSWKKVIYKVICKLDQEIPEIFKSPNVLDHLDEI